jgi:DNA mismatch repair protein MutS
MMKVKETPLMRQYGQIKQKHPESILLFRMGDFFETFEEDAIITAKVCGITLTKRNNGAGADTPLAGFPHHQLDSYLPKLVKAGHRVAVCEQLEDPKFARGIVKRGVVEVVTPGVAFYDKLLETKSNNFLASIYLVKTNAVMKLAGLALVDISTGEFQVCEIPFTNLKDLLNTVNPSEVIISKAQKDDLYNILEKLSFKPLITKLEDWIFEQDFVYDLLLKQFKTKNLKGFGINEFTVGLSAAGSILNYISETQNASLKHLVSIGKLNTGEFMSLDPATRRNLEITFSQSSDGSLFSVIDRTNTPMGGRLLKKWISMPLIKLEPIIDRQNCVEVFYEDENLREMLRKILSKIGDIDRLISKISTGRANPRDCIALKNSLYCVVEIHVLLKNISNSILNHLINKFVDTKELVDLISKALINEPSVQLGTGQVFNYGFSPELDDYIAAKTNGTDWIKDFQNTAREESGINTLKVGFNNVFGYYIEVSKLNAHKVPDNFERKQTLANAERYTTPELKEIESKILGAEEKISEVEQKLFLDLKNQISAFTVEIQTNSNLIATIDCLQALSQIAKDNNYVKPLVDDSEIIELQEARHPVVEKIIPVGEKFTPNDTFLDTEAEQIHIITGPNMSGKSCYLRQVAVITLLAQIGSYVPAKSARIGLVDKIFTRVGAHDNLISGESTFLVEMQEAANILNNASQKSLILLDEVGRGTATFDGISIAWSIAEHLHNKINAKTLFATHYHELNELSERYTKIVNYRVEVIETGNDIIFSHKVTKGSSDYSFGIHVAKMAGLPYDVIQRADEIMSTLESGNTDLKGKSTKADIKSIKTKNTKNNSEQLAIFEFRDDLIREKILSIKIDSITPIQAFNLLVDLQKEAKNK